jgi:hypothetical protein
MRQRTMYIQDSSHWSLSLWFGLMMDSRQGVPHRFADSTFNESGDSYSTLGFVMSICNYPVAWKSKISKTVAHSSFKAEWIAMNGLL